MNFYSFTYSLTTCLGQGISKYRDYRQGTEEGPNRYGGYCLGCNSMY